MKKILMMGNTEITIYHFRRELVERLLEEGHQVYISSLPGDRVNELVEMGCVHEAIEQMDRRGTNPISEMKLLNHYFRVMKRVQPDIVFSYTIKPNIYGAIAARRYGIPFVSNVTGMGSAFKRNGLFSKMIIQLYKIALADAQTVFFQNEQNQQYFMAHHIAPKKHRLLPGSGVNLEHFKLLEYPETNATIDFVFISRLMKEKGIDEYLKAATYIKDKYPNTRFHIAGFFEEGYEEIVREYENNGIINYHGMLEDVRGILLKTHCTVLPSYHEGMSNVLLESAASGRPVLASNIPGCQEIFDEGISGFGLEPGSTESLIHAMEQFLSLTHEEKRAMGLAGRNKIEKQFDRQLVVNQYLEEIEKIVEESVEVRL